MSLSHLEYLFNSYVQNTITSSEEEELMELLAQPENKFAVKKMIDQVIENTGAEIQLNDETGKFILQTILPNRNNLAMPENVRKTGFPYWLSAAAAVLICLAGGVYWIFASKDAAKSRIANKVETHVPILPGGNRALLTTSDGKTIVLDSIANGTLANQGNAKINKQGSSLIYSGSASTKTNVPVVYNTLTTPRGGQYSVVLPDGTKVWLNAASSLHFPTAFTGNQRVVELTGEAYFEVSKNKDKPFQVRVNGMSVNVLGTHFNINAYADDNTIKTSLLEGSVKIIKGKSSDFLKPGEQAIFEQKNDKLKIAKVNMDEVMAWKKGLFQFEGADITAIMREIGRWYNVEIVYAGEIPKRKFEGKISRNAQLSEVLRILELSNVKFTVVGNKIVVQ